MSSGQITFDRGRAYRGIPAAQSDGTDTDLRVDRHGHLYTLPIGKPAVHAADSEIYYVASNPTPGTGLAGIAAADGYDATQALCLVRNNLSPTSAPSGDKRVFLDYLKIQATAAGTSGTNQSYATFIEPGPNTRWVSGGSEITPVNPNASATASGSGAVVRFGALVTSAASASERKLGSGLLRSVIVVVGDVVVFDFGGKFDPTGLAVAGTAICHQVVRHPPVVLGPGAEFLLHINATNQAAASSFEFELGFWEK